MLKDVGGAFENTDAQAQAQAGAGEGPPAAATATAWMPCAVLIDDEGLALAAEAPPIKMRSASRNVLTAEDQTRTPPEPLLPLLPTSSTQGTDPKEGAGVSGKDSKEPLPTPSHRLLLVEDSLALQKMLSRFFQRQGYAVTVANNGREGLDLLTTQPFDVW